MNKSIVDNHNKVVSNDDLVYHLGDFCFNNPHGAGYWESQLNGNIVHIRGNHDRNNGVKTYITHAIMEFGGLQFYVKHEPPISGQMETLETHLMASCDFILCGHVHDLWKHKFIEFWSHGCRVVKLCINVGIDVWDYKPVSVNSILKYISRVRRGLEK